MERDADSTAGGDRGRCLGAGRSSGLNLVRVDARRPPRWVVVDKPAGMLSVPGKGEERQDCAAFRVRAAFPHATGPLVVHRLDMDTSGLLVFGLDGSAQRNLSGQFEARTVDKAYIALVAGVPGAERGVIDAPMRADIANRPYQVIDRERGRPAVTHWSVEAIEPDRTRLRLVPVTGRTHQLRLHCAHAGWPILGDVLYAPGTLREASRLMLHASELAFDDPIDGRRIEAASRPPF